MLLPEIAHMVEKGRTQLACIFFFLRASAAEAEEADFFTLNRIGINWGTVDGLQVKVLFH